MQIDFSKIFRDLLPPGAISDDDAEVTKVLAILGQEFAAIYARLRAVVESLPDRLESPLASRWQELTASKRPLAVLAAQGETTESGQRVSNTSMHFNRSTGSDISFRFHPNLITVRGIPNERSYLLRAGSRCHQALARFTRDEEAIAQIERIRHAHTFVHYEVSHASH